jgi:hypothetical protein
MKVLLLLSFILTTTCVNINDAHLIINLETLIQSCPQISDFIPKVSELVTSVFEGNWEIAMKLGLNLIKDGASIIKEIFGFIINKNIEALGVEYVGNIGEVFFKTSVNYPCFNICILESGNMSCTCSTNFW